MADIIDCAKHREVRKNIYWEASESNNVLSVDEMLCKRYVRFDDITDADKIKAIFKNSEVIDNNNSIEIVTSENNKKTFDSMLEIAYNELGIKPDSVYKIFSL